MNKKISKKGIILISVVSMVVVIAIFFGIKSLLTSSDEQPEETNPITSVSLVSENQVLKVELLDFVSVKNEDKDFTTHSLVVKKGDEIGGIEISADQTFNKIMKLSGPDEESPKLGENSSEPSHNAYILVLTGDIIKYVDEQDNVTYKIENERITYYKQAILLESEINSVYICSIDSKKEKMVQLDEYQSVINDVTKYNTMLNW